MWVITSGCYRRDHTLFFLKQYRHQVPRGSRWTVICISHPSRAVSPPQSPTHFGEGELFTADCDPVTLVPSEMKFHDSLHNFSAILRWREVVWKWGSRWFGNNFGVVYDARFVLERYLHGSEVGSGCAYNSNSHKLWRNRVRGFIPQAKLKILHN